MLSTNSRELTDVIRDIESVTIAEVDVRARAEEVQQLAQAPVREVGEERAHDARPAKTAIDRALRSLTDPGTLRKGHQDGLFLCKVRSNLMREDMDDNDRDKRVHENYPSDGNDLL